MKKYQQHDGGVASTGDASKIKLVGSYR